MKLFKCPKCANLLYFENTSCERCGLKTGYLPGLEAMTAVTAKGGNWTALAEPGQPYRFCANWEQHTCNWLLRADQEETLCRACRHNRTIPDVGEPARQALWSKMESAKRRLFYSLIKLNLPLPLPGPGEKEPLEFDFLTDRPGRKVMTGHDNGLITISLREADDAEREKLRTNMHEPYRTLLGHFRHEVGHFYWDRLVRDGNQLEACRAVFGDERRDYGDAMAAYYRNGPAPDWQKRCVSAYSTMHPWEDFAETWAHYLHIVDTLEMAYSFGLTVSPRITADQALQAEIDRNPYRATSVDELLAEWIPITFAVNSLNRTMGQPDLYPFIISPAATAKLEYIRALTHQTSQCAPSH